MKLAGGKNLNFYVFFLFEHNKINTLLLSKAIVSKTFNLIRNIIKVFVYDSKHCRSKLMKLKIIATKNTFSSQINCSKKKPISKIILATNN